MKLKVPPEAFIAAGVARVIFDFMVRSIVLIPVFIVFQIVPPATALLFPVAVLCLALLGFTLNLLLLPLSSLYKDIGQGVGLLMPFLMYVSAVIFPVPESGLARTVMLCNPITSIVMTARDWLTVGSSPFALSMFVTTAVTFFFLVLASIILRVCMPHLIVRMGM